MESKDKRWEDDCVTLSIDEESIETHHGTILEIGARGSNLPDRDDFLEPKHKVFLSHSGVQKDFVEQLCLDLERCDRYPFFDKRDSSLPMGEKFPQLIFDAIQQCQVGVLVLSEEFFTKTKWPMIELATMVKELKKPNSIIKIIPVFYHISREEWLDLENRTRWILQWEEWASKEENICVEKWKMALEVLKPIKSLVMADRMGDVTVRREIVNAVCNLVFPETRWDDSHIQGRLHLCKVVCERIHQQTPYNGVRVIGLYGIGGIGKTTICKTMCNEMFQEFHGKVCHIELKNRNNVQLLREVLKRFTNIRHDILEGLNIGQCRDQLRRRIVNQAIFLAIDNVSDDLNAIRQAKTYLGTRWSEGSMIIVTARSLGELMCLNQYINERDCVEMPEITKEDAMSLFLNHVTAFSHDGTISMDNQLLRHCVKQCYYSKGIGKGHHYIPLALKVLGEELGCIGYDAGLWNEQLKKIDMFEMELSGNKHPIFSILRTSYDSLSYAAQMLFMDVALLLPSIQYQEWYWGCYLKCNIFEWLSMVHGLNVKEMKRQLEGLKHKSLLEDLGNGWTKIGMHDLWREFCIAETKVKMFGDRRWVFLEEENSELREISPPNRCWENLKRMCFLNEGWRSFQGVNLEDYTNVIVLKVVIGSFVPPSMLELDLKGLQHLKSLELKANKFSTKFIGFGSLKNLLYLRWWSDEGSSPCIEEIGNLTKLRVLEIKGFVGDKLPDLSMLTSLQVACFAHCDKVVTITGLSSKLSNLRCLCLSRCLKLQECSGLGELYALEELDLWGCKQLKEFPSLRLLTNLSRLNISECKLVKAVPGLSDLIALKELRAEGCYGLNRLSNMKELTKLEVLKYTDLSGMDFLDLGEFPLLKEWISSWCRTLKRVTCSKSLPALTVIDLTLCMSLQEMPDLSNFSQLEELILSGCAELKNLTCSVPLYALRILDLEGCKNLNELPYHLNSSIELRILRLQKSGILLNREDIKKLKALCKNLVIFSNFSISKYGDKNGYFIDVISSNRSKDEFDDMDINVQNQSRSRRLWDPLSHEKITKLIYSNAGSTWHPTLTYLLALTSSGIHKRWDWKKQASVNSAPQLWRPIGGVLMINDITDTILGEVIPNIGSMALCKDNDHLFSTSGGNVSLFTMMIDKFWKSFLHEALPSTATSIAFYPQDNDIIAIGMEDSTIAICNAREKQVVCILKGHHKRIIGLAFSKTLRVLVSLGADSQLCMWKTNGWARRQSNLVQNQPDGRSPCIGDIRIQFHYNQIHLLIVGKFQLAIYDALTLNHLHQWNSQSPFKAIISNATYSCDSQLVYVGFVDGSIGIFDAKTLWPRCRLAPPIHTPWGAKGSIAYPTVIVANPVRCNQFALGLSDGDVLVVEPFEVEGEWRPSASAINITVTRDLSSGAIQQDDPTTNCSEEKTSKNDEESDNDIYENAEEFFDDSE